MDAQILAATLATLAAVFAGINGGAFTADDITQTTQNIPETPETGLNNLIPDIPFLKKLTQKPEPSNPVQAQITVNDNFTIKNKNADTTITNLTTIQTNKIKLNSDQQITLNKHTGNIQTGENTTITGNAQGLTTSGVNITTPIKTRIQTQTDTLHIENTQRTTLKFSNASIQPTTNSDFGIQTTNTNLDINSFTGNITLHTTNQTLTINGKVDKLKAGNYQLNTQ